ncbi:MAG: hypothetical protein JJU29_12190 [Verrucomicrobia bacterium]|nr:hypothetical protein [Verrucomicrobiota bacterium]MCH8513120.1 hypothetical protein [Kiritimatiellia bacterium]
MLRESFQTVRRPQRGYWRIPEEFNIWNPYCSPITYEPILQGKEKLDFWPKQVKLVIMKVKVGQLKAHLSQYLREMEASGEPIEVCVRERPVAYLTPIIEDGGKENVPPPELVKSLAANGIRIAQWGRKMDDFVPTPRPAGDGKQIENSVVAMREEKDW